MSPIIIICIEHSPRATYQKSEFNRVVRFKRDEIKQYIDSVFEVGPVIRYIKVQASEVKGYIRVACASTGQIAVAYSNERSTSTSDCVVIASNS